MRGALCSGTYPAKVFARLSDRCVEPSAPGPFRPRFLPAYWAVAWSLLLRDLFGQGFVCFSDRCVEPCAPEPCRPSFRPAFLTDVWSCLPRNLFGEGFCSLFGPVRGALCSGASSAKVSDVFSGRCVELLAPVTFRPPFFFRCSGQCVEPCDPALSQPSLLFASQPIRGDLCSGILPAKALVQLPDRCGEYFAPEADRLSFLSAFPTDAWSLLPRNLFRPSFLSTFLTLPLRSSLGQGFCPLIGPMRGAFCSGTSSAKLAVRLSGRSVELSAPDLSWPKVLPAYRADARSLLLRNLSGQVSVRLSDQCVEPFSPELFRPGFCPPF